MLVSPSASRRQSATQMQCERDRRAGPGRSVRRDGRGVDLVVEAIVVVIAVQHGSIGLQRSSHRWLLHVWSCDTALTRGNAASFAGTNLSAFLKSVKGAAQKNKTHPYEHVLLVLAASAPPQRLLAIPLTTKQISECAEVPLTTKRLLRTVDWTDLRTFAPFRHRM